MPDNTPTNKLSLYLIKDEFNQPNTILSDLDQLKSVQLSTNRTLYYKKSSGSQPGWITKFFGSSLNDGITESLYTAYVSAVLLITLDISGTTKRFAITFGLGGWQMLMPGSYEERFGLMCTLNLVSPTTLKSIDKTNMGLSPKQAREQINQQGEIADFGIDIEQDLIKSVTGKCKDPSLGTTVTGKDSLHFSAKTDLTNIEALLRKYYAAYSSDEYKINFNWIDYIAEVRDPLVIENLESSLNEKLTDTSEERVWLAVPDVIEWSDVEGFYYQGDRNQVFPDLFMKNLREYFDSKGLELNVENLRKHFACSVSSSHGNVINRWKLFNCLCAEISNTTDNKFYILSNGKWYNVEVDFAAQVNIEYRNILDTSSALPTCTTGEDEATYNERVANELGLICMDRKIVTFGGGHSKIEFCDLYKETPKTIIHIKKYGGSTVLSHLFNQGVVSAELMLGAEDFRQKVNDVSGSHAIFDDVSEKPSAQDYNIVYGVISGSSKELDLPFFSKVSLKNAKQRLELYGYTVSLQKIDTAPEA